MMSRASFSQKSMEWICSILKEASKVKGNIVRRWRRQEHVSHLFCARNFNNKGRYISIISIQGKSRTVLIVPEISFNAGWWDLATKIEKFISYKANKSVDKNYRMVDKEIPYAETVRRSKWSSREINSAVIKERGDTIFINGVLNQPRNELLGRSLVGSFPINGSEMPTLSEVRRWAAKPTALTFTRWETTAFSSSFHPLMRLNMFLEEDGCGRIKEFGCNGVGDFCGSWLTTEEETELRNLLKWARILVKANGISIPKEVKIVFEGIEYIIQVWDETPTRNLVASDRKGDPVHLFYGDRDENFEFLAAIRDDDDMSIIQTEERTTTETQTENNMLMEQKAEGEGIIEDIIPLNSDEHETGIAAKNEIPSWVQQNIIRLSKEFGVHFIGCEEAALKFLHCFIDVLNES
ncbi:hypothetical protein MTR67_006737 [Solanum verrucosum]|uniref:Uncharacterized protein n=1 Tax=Solanum verrucosum TaxID=315347 RepID=A0AAF0PYT8_SOLVR|nr:hypothetical protein MTR67_006737 [Solanum verrucosum]